MSWSAFGKFMLRVGAVAPAILAVSPLAPIAGIVQMAIVDAQAIQGATGEQKLAHVLNLANETASAINAQAGHPVVDVTALNQTAASVISSIISATKIPAGTPVPTPAT